MINPDDVLARYPDWKDSSYWPESSRTVHERKKLADKQGDPKSKEGVVGAFCRTYTVTDVIEKYLSDIYVPCEDPNRYTYSEGSTAGGLVIYGDGDFAYSHHSTDPLLDDFVMRLIWFVFTYSVSLMNRQKRIHRLTGCLRIKRWWKKR
ncbi:hypothetical protein KHA80_12150 [Anaerobacillus sp. HL2]|nr:hypothetical protein KHA80_12150 [Anaerobacillus sp. HL2]